MSWPVATLISGAIVRKWLASERARPEWPPSRARQSHMCAFSWPSRPGPEEEEEAATKQPHWLSIASEASPAGSAPAAITVISAGGCIMQFGKCLSVCVCSTGRVSLLKLQPLTNSREQLVSGRLFVCERRPLWRLFLGLLNLERDRKFVFCVSKPWPIGRARHEPTLKFQVRTHSAAAAHFLRGLKSGSRQSPALARTFNYANRPARPPEAAVAVGQTNRARNRCAGRPRTNTSAGSESGSRETKRTSAPATAIRPARSHTNRSHSRSRHEGARSLAPPADTARRHDFHDS